MTLRYSELIRLAIISLSLVHQVLLIEVPVQVFLKVNEKKRPELKSQTLLRRVSNSGVTHYQLKVPNFLVRKDSEPIATITALPQLGGVEASKIPSLPNAKTLGIITHVNLIVKNPFLLQSPSLLQTLRLRTMS